MAVISLADPAIYDNDDGNPTNGELLRNDLNTVFTESNSKETRLDDLETNNMTINGTKTFGQIIVLPSSNPTLDNQATRKGYVDGMRNGQPFQAGHVYTLPYVWTTGSTGSITQDRLIAHPINVPEACSIANITFMVSTAGTGSARVGLYLDNGGVPGALIVDGGTASVASTGTKVVSFSATPVEPGDLWVAIVLENAGTACRVINEQNMVMRMGQLSSGLSGGNSNNIVTGYSASHAYAALPTPFPSGGFTTTSEPKPLMYIGI